MFEKLVFTVLGFFLGVVFQQYRAARSEEAAQLNDHIKDIERFSDAAQSYWLKRPKDEDEEALLAAKVRVAHSATTPLYEAMSKLCEGRGGDYQTRSRLLFTQATGGDFEGTNRAIDPGRAMAVGDRATELIHLLRLTRLDLLSVRHMVRVVKWWARDLWKNHGPKE